MLRRRILQRKRKFRRPLSSMCAEKGQNRTKIYCMKMVTTGLVGRNQKLLSFAFAARGSADWVTQPRLIVRARTGFAATITWHLDVNCN